MSENIHIKNPKAVEQKIQAFKIGGAEHIQVMADFDRTLSKGFIAGQKSPSVIAQIRNGDYLSQEYVKKSHALFDHYHVIEIDHDIPKKEKMKEMHNWRKEHFVLLAESGLNEEILEEVIENKTLQFRENIDEFMRILEKAQIPLCIFSASIGDMIQAYLEQDDILTANTHIIANFLIYDEEGNVLGAKEPIIHSMNKSEVVVHEFSFFQKLKQRKNIILMGDLLDDLGMSEGFDYENILTIGFCNIADQKADYMKAFDIVIMNDPGMDEVNEILKRVLE